MHALARNGRIQFRRKLSPSGFAAAKARGLHAKAQKSENEPPAPLSRSLAPANCVGCCWVNLQQHARNRLHSRRASNRLREREPTRERGKNFDSRQDGEAERAIRSRRVQTWLAEIKTEAGSVCLQLISGPQHPLDSLCKHTPTQLSVY
jgi:hypothetical protein